MTALLHAPGCARPARRMRNGTGGAPVWRCAACGAEAVVGMPESAPAPAARQEAACAVCGVLFRPRHTGASFCSTACISGAVRAADDERRAARRAARVGRA